MIEDLNLKHPWLAAVWPGMGNVALNSGVYLLAKLNMQLIGEFQSNELFDIEQVSVKDGLVEPTQRPRNRMFLWRDPHERHDLVLFLGEAQPQIGKYAFCKQLIEGARQMGIERVITFAAMASPMHPEQTSHVFSAVTDANDLAAVRKLEVKPVEDGNIGGLNGVLLGAAAEAGIPGVCFLGEMPEVFVRLPYPQASLKILKVFAEYSGISIDLTELTEQSEMMDQQLGAMLNELENAFGQDDAESDEEEAAIVDEPSAISPAQSQQIEDLFRRSAENRAAAYELKHELDRLGVFKQYEDRFLDLFKKSG